MVNRLPWSGFRQASLRRTRKGRRPERLPESVVNGRVGARVSLRFALPPGAKPGFDGFAFVAQQGGVAELMAAGDGALDANEEAPGDEGGFGVGGFAFFGFGELAAVEGAKALFEPSKLPALKFGGRFGEFVVVAALAEFGDENGDGATQAGFAFGARRGPAQKCDQPRKIVAAFVGFDQRRIDVFGVGFEDGFGERGLRLEVVVDVAEGGLRSALRGRRSLFF